MRQFTPRERGEVERGSGQCHARRACNRLSQPPFPRPAPPVTSKALPYPILRRMSSTRRYTAPPCCAPLRRAAASL